MKLINCTNSFRCILLATLMVPSLSSALQKVDFNQDNQPDLFTIDTVNKELDLFTGLGDGTFNPVQAISLPLANNPELALPIDINSDGFGDLIALGDNGVLSYLLNDGSNGFGSENVLSTGLQALESITDVTVVDFNGDALTDVVIGINGLVNGRVLLFPRNGSGFDPYISINLGLLASPEHVYFADLNVDGHLDMAVEDALGGLYRVFSDGLGGFNAPSLSLGSLPTGTLRISDLDGDGTPDLISLDEVLGLLTVRLGNGDGTFGTGLSFNTGLLPADLVIADINLDGLEDILVVNADGDSIDLFLGDAINGLVKAAINILEDLLGTIPTLNTPIELVTGDFNSDCIQDYAIWNGLTNDFIITLNQLGPDPSDLIFCSVFEIL